MIQSDSASSTLRKQDRPSMVSSSKSAPDLASELRIGRRSVAPATSSSIVSTAFAPFMMLSMHRSHPPTDPPKPLGDDGLSGATLERVRLHDSRTVVVKRQSPRTD